MTGEVGLELEGGSISFPSLEPGSRLVLEVVDAFDLLLGLD